MAAGDAGRDEVTDRDREIVAWIGRVGAVTVGHVMAHFRIGRSVAFDRIAVCVRAGHLARTHTLYAAPALLTATRRGLRYAGLEELGLVAPTGMTGASAPEPTSRSGSSAPVPGLG